MKKFRVAGVHRAAGAATGPSFSHRRGSIRPAGSFREAQRGEFVVTTNNEHIPHLRISNVYKDLMSQGENSAEVKNYIRERFAPGNFSSRVCINGRAPLATSRARS